MEYSEELSLANNFELKGSWWLEGKDSSTEGQRGTLSFDPSEKSSLVLDTPIHPPNSEKKWPNSVTIYGRLENGRTCSLLNVFPTECLPFDSAATDFFFNKAFIGSDTVSEKSRFVSVIVSFTSLGEWLKERPVKQVLAQKPAGRDEFSIIYKQPKRICFRIPSIQASLRFIHAYHTSSSGFHSITLNHKSEIEILPKTKQPFEWYWRQIEHLRILLTLLMGHSPKITSLTFRANTSSQNIEYIARLIQKGYSPEKTHWFKMPFPYDNATSFRQKIRSWFERRARINNLCELYYGVRTSPSLPIQFRFIALTQALESYHRTLGQGNYIDDEGYNIISSALVSNIPKDTPKPLRNALTTRIKYGNQFSLRKRLQSILSDVPESVRQKIVGNDSSFVERIVSTRNYLTHRDEEISCKSMDYHGQFDACEQMKMLIEFILLREVGVGLEQLEEAFCNSLYYQHLPKRIIPL